VTGDCKAELAALGQACSKEGGVDAGCSASTTMNLCQACCQAGNSGGFDSYELALTSCICDMPGLCVSQCSATACAGAAPPAGTPCSACIAKVTGPDGGCASQIAGQCASDPHCTAYEACLESSGCAKK
jgi:hypothetical protein